MHEMNKQTHIKIVDILYH